MTTTKSVLFGDWSSGDYGLQDPTVPGFFRGLDVMVYRDGSVGPRPPMRPFPVTGYGTAEILHAILTTKSVYTVGQPSIVTIDSAGTVRGFSVGNRSGDTPTGDGVTTSPGVVTGANCLVEFNRQLFVVRSGAAGVVVSDSAITSVPAMPTGQAAVAYGDQLVILKDISVGSLNEIQWSAPADATTWPAANFLKVGSGPAIVAMRESRNSLVFGLKDGTWWVLTGPLGPSAVLRRADRSAPPDDIQPISPSRTQFQPITVTNSGSIRWTTRQHLFTFTGAQATLEPLLDPPYHARDVLDGGVRLATAAPLLGDEQLAISGYTSPNPIATTTIGTIIANPNDAWVRWQVPGILDSTSPVAAALSDGSGILFVLVQATGSAATAPKFYTVNTRTRSPLYSGAASSASASSIIPVTPTDGDTGAVVAGTLRTHTWWHPEMLATRVKAVVLDLVYEASHIAGGHVGLSVAVEAVNNSTDVDHLTSAVHTWTPTPPKLTSTGTNTNPHRVVFRFGDQGPGPGFRLVFTNLKGCTIRRAMAIVDVDDDVRF